MPRTISSNALLSDAEDHALHSFAHLMSVQLVRNIHKGGRPNWLALDNDTLLRMLRISVKELEIAIEEGMDIHDKAADVANYAFFLWDKANVTDT